MSKQKPDYGIDSPKIIRRLLGGGGILMFAGVMSGVFPSLFIFAMPAISIGATLFLAGVIMLWGSLAGKPRLRDKMLKDLNLQGNEKVLDIGCGNGLLLIGVAKFLNTGKATGIDNNQSGNPLEKARANAKIEGAEKKIELKKADVRSLPFVDESFDVVLSGWTLNELKETSEREKALRELIRVTKKNGKIVVADFSFAQDYAVFFEQNGLENIQLSRPYFLFVFPSFIVTGNKKQDAPTRGRGDTQIKT